MKLRIVTENKKGANPTGFDVKVKVLDSDDNEVGELNCIQSMVIEITPDTEVTATIRACVDINLDGKLLLDRYTIEQSAKVLGLKLEKDGVPAGGANPRP